MRYPEFRQKLGDEGSEAESEDSDTKKEARICDRDCIIKLGIESNI